MFIRKFSRFIGIGCLGTIMCLLYSPFLFAGESEQNMPARMLTSSIGFAGEDRGYLSRIGWISGIGERTPLLHKTLTDSLNVELLGRALYGSSKDVFIRDTFAFVGTEAAMLIFDISDPLEPSLLGHIHIHLAMVFDIYVVDDYAYISQVFLNGSKGGIQIVDISDPTNPQEVGYYEWNDYLLGIYATSNYVYACAENNNQNENGLLILDVSDPANPSQVSFLDFGGGPFGYWTQEVVVVGNYAYVASCLNGLKIVDVSDPTAPSVVGTFQPGDVWNRDVSVVGDYAYLTDGEADSLIIVDISNPTQPQYVSACGLPELSIKLYIAGNYAYVARQEWYGQQGGLVIIDIFNPTNPFETGSCNIEGSPFKVNGDTCFAYLADKSGGLVVVDVSDASVPVPVADWYTGFIANSVEVVGIYAYIADYRFWNPYYTAKGALRIVDISDPVNPVLVSSFRSERQCREVSVQLPHAYIADQEGGLRIVNVSDPTNPWEVGCYNTPEFYGNGIDVVGDYAYVKSDSFFIIDISEPINPFVMGKCDATGTRVFVDGNYAYITSNCPSGSGMYIVNISNPVAPFVVGFHPTHGSPPLAATSEVYVVSDLAYIADGTGGLRIVDVSDPAYPVEISNLTTRGPATSIYVAGNYAYVGTSYMMNGIPGVEVIDISDTYNPVMVGYYDLYNVSYDVYVVGDTIYVANGQCGFYILRYTGTGIAEKYLEGVSTNMLSQNSPNPFALETRINYTIPKSGKVTLEVYNVLGQKVKTLVNKYRVAGNHTISWDGRDNLGNRVQGGVYFYRFKTETDGRKFTTTKKLILLR